MVTGVPAVTEVALVVTTYFAAAPAAVVIGAAAPAIEPVLADTTCDTPAVVLGVNTTVATPLPFVAVVGLAKLPPLVLDHVTTCPGVATALPFASASCAVNVTVVPAPGARVLAVTRYCVAAPATIVTTGLEPVRPLSSVVVNENVAPATWPVTNSTVATPCVSVVDVADAKVSPALFRPASRFTDTPLVNPPAPPVLLHR